MQKSFLVLFAIVSVVALHAKAETTPRIQADDLVVISPPGEPPEDVIAFWTPKNMTEAWQARGATPPGPPLSHPLNPRADGSGYILMTVPYAEHKFSRLTGILFIREVDLTGEVLKHCSASLIKSKSESVILAAAHCFLDASGGHLNWYNKLMFVPAYRENADGTKDIPLGKWPVQRAFIPAAYIPKPGDEQEFSADVGVARVYPESPSSSVGRRVTLEQTVGDAFIPEVSVLPGRFPLVKVIGYPSVPPLGEPSYDLGEQRQCDSHTKPSSEAEGNMVLVNCAPQSGNSGGPLVDMSRPEARRVLGVFAWTIPLRGQPILRPQTFFPIFSAADREVLP